MTDLIVIGAGTAGMTAALYALRNGKTVKIFDSEGYGGQIANSPRVENFPSVKVISGSDFADKLFDQINDFGAEYEYEKILHVEKKGKTFVVTGEYGEYESKTVVIASGVKHKTFGLPNEQELVGKGISYCAVCDGAFYKGKEVVLIGDANTALQYALLLSNYCTKVKLCTLFNKFFGDEMLVKAVKGTENIEIIQGISLIEIKGKESLESLVFKETYGEKTFEMPAEALFVAIGQVPDNKAFENVVDIDERGFIVAGEDCKTKTEGLFAAGDCRTKAIRQLTTAAADGAIAAMNASTYIASLGE